jgi:hypothetical protein
MRNLLFLSVTLIIAFAPCCGENGSSVAGRDIPSGGNLRFPEGVDVAASFGDSFYEPVDCAVEPAMPALGLPVDPGSVINLEPLIARTGLGQPPGSLLRNGFVVYRPVFSTDNPVTAFETLASWNQPVFVSAGIPLHLLHIFFDQILQQVEEEHLSGDLTLLCRSLYQANIERDCSLGAAYFGVPLALLDPDFEPDPTIADEVAAELALIDAHAGFAESPVFGYQEDYSQYVPRGHYTAGETLERYFRAMMWLGRLTLILNGGDPHGSDATYIVSAEDALAMTACALQTVSDLETLEPGGERLLDVWARIYEVTAFFAGFADDHSVPEYAAAGREIAGAETDLDRIWTSDFHEAFRNLVNEEYAGPSIYSGTGGLVSMPDAQGGFDPGDLAAAFSKTTGFRFLGQRYTPDSEILGKLVFPAVGADPSGRQRFMPTGLDVAAAFGCAAAIRILEQQGDFEFANYADTLASMGAMIHDYTPEDWHATLYMSWLHSLHLLRAVRGEGYPDFMRTEAWQLHTLSDFLASWAMLRHDTILYAKQSYTMEAGCAPGFEEPVPSAGFVEPVPEVFAELSATLQMARRGLDAYGLLDEALSYRFESALNVMTRLQAIAERELAGQPITSEDADFLKGFSGWLESAIAWDGETEEGLETSLIADVHTDQNSCSVLEVASGELDYCIVAYMRPDGVAEVAIGPVLSYYEFTWPMSDRLTDEAWREKLRGAERPSRPSWTEAFVEGGPAPLD